MPRRVGLGALLAVLAWAAAAPAQDLKNQAATFAGGVHPSQIHLVPIDLTKATRAYYAARVIGQQKKNPLALLSTLPKVGLPTWPFKSSQPKVVSMPIPQQQKAN
jgi:hypothetical protein